MTAAVRGAWARPFAVFALVLTLVVLQSLAAFGQTGGTGGEKTTEQKVEALSEALRTRGTELDDLEKAVKGHANDATSAMMEKELSDRRARYRRDVSQLVTLLIDGQDAGATVADGRALATRILREEAKAMRAKVGELGAESLRLVNITSEGTAEEIANARRSLQALIPRSSRLMEYLDVNVDERRKLETLAEQTKERHKQLKETVSSLQESIDFLRLSIKYLLFDLEATRRENAYLRKMLEEDSGRQE